MKTAAKQSRRRKRAVINTGRWIATRNGVPCYLEPVKVRATGFRFSGNVLFPLPLPPSDPKEFRTLKAAERARERSERLERLISGSIHRDFIITKFPSLKPYGTLANYDIIEHRPAKS